MKVEDRWHRTRRTGAPLCNCGARKEPRAEHGTGRRWAVTVAVGGRRTKKFFDTKDAAEAYLVESGHARRNGQYVSPRDGRITLREVARQYLDSRSSSGSIRDSSRRSLAGRLERHVFPALGDHSISQITEADVERMIAGWSLAPSTRRGLITEVRGIYRFAARRRYVPKGFNPAEDIKLPEKSRTRIVLPTPQQIDLAAGALPDRYRALLFMAVGSGMRISEILGITRDRITVRDGLMRVTVDRQLAKVTTRSGPVFSDPKTKAGFRTVVLTRELSARMQRHMMTWCAADGLVFTVRGGAPLRYGYASRILADAMRTVGLKPAIGQVTERSGWHQFRHYHVSQLMSQGVDPVKIAKRLGHEDIAVTFNTYSHLLEEGEDAVIAALSATESFASEQRTVGLRVVGK